MTVAEHRSAAGLVPDKMPQHVAIIMDGNGRWALKRGNQRVFGHKAAITAVRDTVECAAELGIGYLTLYAFSTENWKRPKLEVDALMRLLVGTLRKETHTLQENKIRLNAIGQLDDLPNRTRRELQDVMDITAENEHMTLNLALSYGGRSDIVHAVRQLAQAVQAGTLQPEAIDDALLAARLSTHGMPEPELIVRTSGELRISNFLLWEGAYAEFYVTDTLWPDFRKGHFIEALQAYQRRERRFGKTSEQIQAT